MLGGGLGTRKEVSCAPLIARWPSSRLGLGPWLDGFRPISQGSETVRIFRNDLHQKPLVSEEYLQVGPKLFPFAVCNHQVRRNGLVERRFAEVRELFFDNPVAGFGRIGSRGVYVGFRGRAPGRAGSAERSVSSTRTRTLETWFGLLTTLILPRRLSPALMSSSLTL